jgi:hypothetical protein
MKSGLSDGGAFHQVMKKPSAKQLLSIEVSPFPLSSRAKPRDLRFYGPLLEFFFETTK